MSHISRQLFDLTLEVLNNALQELNDLQEKKKGSAEIEAQTQWVYFCRHLAISPNDIMMGSEVTLLFDNFHRVLKSAKDDCKMGMLASLKSLVDNLNFASV